MTGLDYLVLVVIFVAALGVGLYFLNKWASTKMVEQQETMDRVKQMVTIFVIDKKKEKAANSTLPKEVKSKLPKIYRFMKVPLVKAKVGPQIVTLISEQKVFDALPVKKNIKVELAGIYIAGMQGLKSKKELQAMAKAKKAKGASAEPEKWYDKINPRKLMKNK
ncbi:MAG: hypothetical protein LBS84_13590 [Clostridiales bacterium]|jgi:hypothetical protein|nr:hypothetical protein [Clostridiales bacterium]